MSDDPMAFSDEEAQNEEKKPNGHAARKEASDVICEHAEPHNITSIPPRQWAYGTFLLFGEPSVLGAIDGGGKGAIAIIIALSFITKRALLGEHVWRSGPVAVITYEDKEVEWRRRIAAACIHYDIDYESVISQFHFIRKQTPGARIRLAAPSPNGTIFPDGDAIISHLKRIGAVLLIIDPFNHAHALEDGNSNVMIAKVAEEAGRIAEASGAAVLALHHLRKGATGGADDLMGATSLRATFRSCLVLMRMGPKEAETLGLDPKQAWRHIRISGSKENYAPPPDLATWYRLESIDLHNPDDTYTTGDNVQVATQWTPPSAFEGLSLTIIARIFEDLRKEPTPNEFYSPDRRSTRWLGNSIIKHSDKKPAEAASIISTWVKNDVLIKDKYYSPESKAEVVRATLNEIQAAAILAPIYHRANYDDAQ